MCLAVRGAPISRDADWLPAIEQFGEGVFRVPEASLADIFLCIILHCELLSVKLRKRT
jgi:hypothetical protein